MMMSFVSVLIGAFVAWLVAWFYYKKAGDELKKEAASLHCTVGIILRWLEAGGKNVLVIHDQDGKPTGLNYSLSLSDSVSATDSVDKIGPTQTNNGGR